MTTIHESNIDCLRLSLASWVGVFRSARLNGVRSNRVGDFLKQYAEVGSGLRGRETRLILRFAERGDLIRRVSAGKRITAQQVAADVGRFRRPRVATFRICKTTNCCGTPLTS